MITSVSRVAAGAALLLVALGLSACAPGVPAGGDGTSASPSDSASGTPSADPGDGDGAAPACTRDDLDIVYEYTDGTAGQLHGILRMTNSAPSPCSLDGYPILFMGSSEVAEPVGQQASQNDVDPPVPVVLEPGNVAEAAVTITQAGNVGCDIVQTTHFVAAPPLDHAFAWLDDGRNVPIDAIDSCNEDSVGLLMVGGLHPAP
jgi:hypothetical protein